MNATYLLMVTPEGNHNKFYRMLPNFPNDSHFTVEWVSSSYSQYSNVSILYGITNVIAHTIKRMDAAPITSESFAKKI